MRRESSNPELVFASESFTHLHLDLVKKRWLHYSPSAESQSYHHDLVSPCSLPPSLPPSLKNSEWILGLCWSERTLACGHLEFTDKEPQMSFPQVMKCMAPLRLLSHLAGDLESPLCLVQASIKQCKIGLFITHFRV